jgi:hypothetical protein
MGVEDGEWVGIRLHNRVSRVSSTLLHYRTVTIAIKLIIFEEMEILINLI